MSHEKYDSITSLDMRGGLSKSRVRVIFITRDCFSTRTRTLYIVHGYGSWPLEALVFHTARWARPAATKAEGGVCVGESKCGCDGDAARSRALKCSVSIVYIG